MAHPKRRHSVSRKGMRRAHDFLVSPTPGLCSKCGQSNKSHQICGYCGFYRGIAVIKMEADAPAATGGDKK